MLDNSNLYCTLEFIYSKDCVPELIKRIVENQFLDARSKVIEILNPKYEEWNAEYDKDVNGSDDMEYNAYIQRKHNEIFDDFNRTLTGPVQLWSDEYADICGKFRYFNETITFHMGIHLINEKEWREYRSKDKEA